MVIARLLYLDIHGRLSRMERKVLRASVLGYRNGEIATLLGLTYQQVKRARYRIAAKARSLWDVREPQSNDGHMELPAAAARAPEQLGLPVWSLGPTRSPFPISLSRWPRYPTRVDNPPFCLAPPDTASRLVMIYSTALGFCPTAESGR